MIDILKGYSQKFYQFYLKNILYIGSYYSLIPITKPANVHLEFTYNCNLRCLHCNFWKKKKKEELSIDEIKKLISDLSDWLGNFFLLISGGEPFMRDDLLEIADYAANKGIGVNVNTNAALIDKTLAKKIINSKIDTLFISLDSLNPKEHDFTRNVEGTTKKVLDAIKYLSKFRREMNSHLKIRVHSIIMGQNMDSIINLVNFVKKNKQIDCINFGFIQPNFDSRYKYDWYKNSRLWFENSKKAISLVNKLVTIKNTSPHLISNSFKELENMKCYVQNPLIKKKICLQFKDIKIDPYGNLKACSNNSPVLLENIKKQQIKEIWNLNKKRIVTYARKCDAPCVDICLDFNVGIKKRLKNLKDKFKFINEDQKNG